jgi:hypothetical protein
MIDTVAPRHIVASILGMMTAIEASETMPVSEMTTTDANMMMVDVIMTVGGTIVARNPLVLPTKVITSDGMSMRIEHNNMHDEPIDTMTMDTAVDNFV